MTVLLTLDLSNLNHLLVTSPVLDSHFDLVLHFDHSLPESAALCDQDLNLSMSGT